MKTAAAALFIAAVSATDVALKTEVTPIQKVTQLLQGMIAKGQKAMEDEKVQYKAYEKFCDSTAAEKKFLIDKEMSNIESLKADIEKAKVDAARLAQEMSAHTKDLNVTEADLAQATKVRTEEKATFTATYKDMTESIAALGTAIMKIKKGAADKKTNAFVEVAELSHIVHPDTQLSLAAMLQGPGGYGSATGGVQQMLKELQEKFQEDRAKLEREETEKQNTYSLLAQSLNHQISQVKKQFQEKNEYKAKRVQEQSTAEGALAAEQTALAADTKYRADLVKTCTAKAADFQERQKLRAEELEAVKKAVEIISGASVSGVAKKFGKFAQVSEGAAFAQLRTAQRNSQAQLAQFLHSQAGKLNNNMLAQVALSATADTFGKVKKMIKDLLARLKEEEGAEATHAAWCKKETSANDKLRKDKAATIKELSADIDGLKAALQTYAKDTVEIKESVSKMAKALANATAIRQKEKVKNAATIADAQEAQLAVANAIKVLQDFYAKAGNAKAFVQLEGEQAPPAVFDAPYKGMQNENGGVIGMLEVIQSDFSRLEAETKAAEANSQKAFLKLQADTKKDTAAKNQDLDFTANKIQQSKTSLSTKTGDLSGSQKELKAAENYFTKLQSSCVEKGPTYEERVKQRQQEIDTLKEALQMITAEAA